MDQVLYTEKASKVPEDILDRTGILTGHEEGSNFMRLG